jgi:hypothetical protein
MRASNYFIPSWVFILSISTGCIATAQHQPGVRNPLFTAQLAPEPAVAAKIVACIPTNARHRGFDLLTQMEILMKNRIPVAAIELDPQQQQIVCANLADSPDSERGYYPRIDPQTGWQMNEVLVSMIKELTAKHRAQSVLITLAGFHVRCEEDQRSIVDENDRPIITIKEGTRTCVESREVEMKSYLLSAQGALLWRASSVTNYVAANQEMAANIIFSTVPARFTASTAGTATNPAPGTAQQLDPKAQLGPQVAENQPDMEDVIASLDPTVPKVCRTLLREVCIRFPENARGKACQITANNYRATFASPSARKFCTTSLSTLRANPIAAQQ